MRTLASLLALAYALLVALWFGAFLFVGERTWWQVLLPAVIPWIFVLSFPFALALALLGRWSVGRWALLAVGLLASWLWGGLFLPPSPFPRAAASGAQLRVMTLNTLVENQEYDRLVAAVESADADILAIQELSPGQADAISSRLGETYPYHALHPWPDPRGIGLWSRYPVTEIATYDEGDWENWAQHVVVEMAGKRIHIFNVHAWPVALDQPRQIMMSAALHQKQTEQLATTLARIPPVEPFVVAGDFNLVPLNRAYRPLTRVAGDTWAAAGWGFGFTFPDQASGDGPAFTFPPPLVRIDYLWHSPSLHPLSIQFLPGDTGSDHRGLVAEYLVP